MDCLKSSRFNCYFTDWWTEQKSKLISFLNAILLQPELYLRSNPQPRDREADALTTVPCIILISPLSIKFVCYYISMHSHNRHTHNYNIKTLLNLFYHSSWCNLYLLYYLHALRWHSPFVWKQFESISVRGSTSYQDRGVPPTATANDVIRSGRRQNKSLAHCSHCTVCSETRRYVRLPTWLYYKAAAINLKKMGKENGRSALYW